MPLDEPNQTPPPAAGYDVIGDVHGRAEALEVLLAALGYAPGPIGGGASAWSHPTRRALFLGDLVDRGPDIPRVLSIVHAMVMTGDAECILGNHELNALAFETTHDPALDPTGDLEPDAWCRAHNAMNTRQYSATVMQLPDRDVRLAALAWTRALPFALERICEHGGTPLRVVHAVWDDRAIARLERLRVASGGITNDLLRSIYAADTTPCDDAETVTKGRKMRMPKKHRHLDHEGNARRKIRIRWYDAPEGRSFEAYALPSLTDVCELPVPDDARPTSSTGHEWRPYPDDAPPVIFGHYRLGDPEPIALRPNVACLDRAGGESPCLAAYRFDGESTIDEAKVVRVPIDGATGAPIGDAFRAAR